MLRVWANAFELSARLNMVEDGQLLTVFTEVPDNTRYLIMTRSRTPFPLHATASGKAYLASLPETVVDKYIKDTRLVAYTDKTITKDSVLKEEIEATPWKSAKSTTASAPSPFPFSISEGNASVPSLFPAPTKKLWRMSAKPSPRCRISSTN